MYRQDSTSYEVTCDDGPIETKAQECSQIDNCYNTICRNSDNTASVTAGSGCKMCRKYYSGGKSYTTFLGHEACYLQQPIANCDFFMGQGLNTHNCWACKNNFAIANNYKECIGFTTDSNCKRLTSANTACYECYDSYYWNTSKCKLQSAVVSFGLMILVVLGLFM